jgi:hypothetical protein
MGERAYLDIVDKFQMKDNIDQYAEFLIEVFDNNQKKSII